MSHFAEYKDDIIQAVQVLKEGGLILYPTDTIWGIGCDATNEIAVSRIFTLKKRTDTRSMLVLIDSENRLSQYVKEIPAIAWDLIDVADKPLTIIYPGAKNLANNLISNDGSIGIRISKEAFSSDLVKKFGKAIVSTSANISGKISPSTFSDIEPEILEGVNYIVKYRQKENQKAQPSSILRIGFRGEIEILRH
ncbi:MAG: threonylcarbamoyl-AMP synthase [Bacteroidales bacterium]|nr:threonylcarbamoyl-AMP synthase [Bacteroidales bacterium]